MKSQTLWDNISQDDEILQTWKSWLNRYGENGELIDDSDEVSFIAPNNKYAIKIMYELDGQFGLTTWFSDFDTDDNQIEVLNVVFDDFSKTLEELPKMIKDWLA